MPCDLPDRCVVPRMKSYDDMNLPCAPSITTCMLSVDNVKSLRYSRPGLPESLSSLSSSAAAVIVLFSENFLRVLLCQVSHVSKDTILSRFALLEGRAQIVVVPLSRSLYRPSREYGGISM
jgi:hypothetical protein